MNRTHYDLAPHLVKPAICPFYTEGAYQQLLEDKSKQVTIAVDNSMTNGESVEIICGLVILHFLFADLSHPAFIFPKRVLISEIIVELGYRRLGVAGKLMAEAESAARNFGAEKLTLNVFALNTSAIALYETWGLHPTKIEMEKNL